MKCIKFLILLLLAAVFAGCIAHEEHADERMQIAVSILPQKEFVESVGKDKVSVMVMIPPGASPATYELSPGQLKDISRAKLYVRIGHIPFEKTWITKITSANRDMLVVDSSKGIDIVGNDPHIWLSPALVKIQVKHISDALIEVDPDNREYYIRNTDEYIRNLDDLDSDIRKNLSGIKNRKFMVFHPAWGYFARDYQLEQIPIEIEGKEPSASDLAGLVDVAKANNITVIFAEPQFNSESARVIAGEIGGTVVVIDPLAENYITNMYHVSETLARYMR
ncbi:MAG: zinc ABC transporter solute-binding protein [Nitrospiraceae bacterium]|nr:zinc ABC transporter solute-binding protein [Nitrospiraceae bacterium]